MIALVDPTDADVDGLLDLMEPFNAAEGIPWDRDRFAAALATLRADPALGFARLIRRGDDLVGYVVFTYGYDLEYGGRDGFVTELYVRPEARRQGVGQAALEALAAECRRSGVRAVHLLVRPENTSAIALYDRVGFVSSPRRSMTLVLDPLDPGPEPL